MFRYTLTLCVTLLSLLAFAPLPGLAQDKDTKAPIKEKVQKEKKAVSPIIPALKKIKKVKGRVNEKADYFIFLYSASWCGPCCREMPEIVKTYKDIKKSGKVDIVLFCQDNTMNAAKNFVNNFRIKFLTVMGNDDKCAKVPGHAPSGGIPHCNIVDRAGRTIISGHPGNVLEHWKSYTIDKESAEIEE
ncbi:MAG: TlpA family protein disulfide reductase [Akkermansia sp.]|nr:TlpA family protein disulfide reductase [Akkermansia sp.]